MRLNLEKFKVMHFGKSSLKPVYYVTDDVGNENDIEEINLERDLGANVGNNLKLREHVDRMVSIGLIIGR